MDNFNLDELMDLAEACVGPMVDAIYRQLMARDFALEDPEVVMLLIPLINILGHDDRGPGQRTDVQDRLGEAPTRRTINPRRRLGPVNPTAETTSTSRSDTRSETTSTSREERRPDRSSLMWSRPKPSPWHLYEKDPMKLNLQMVSFAADAMRILNGARLSVNGVYSITGVDWLKAAGINFSSTNALRFANLEGLEQYNGSGECKTVTRREKKDLEDF